MYTFDYMHLKQVEIAYLDNCRLLETNRHEFVAQAVRLPLI